MRNAWKKYEDAKVRVIGVSSDSVKSHQGFAKKHKLPFSLVSDQSGEWARAFGVKSTLGFYSRKSFLIDPSGKIVRVYPDVDPGVHALVVLRDVKGIRCKKEPRQDACVALGGGEILPGQS